MDELILELLEELFIPEQAYMSDIFFEESYVAPTFWSRWWFTGETEL